MFDKNLKIKAGTGLLALVLVMLLTGPVHAAHIKVFLLGGQSNMDGRGVKSGLPTSPDNLQQPQTDVLLYEGGSLRDLQPGSQFGPEITFGRTIADALPDDNFALIKNAAGGTNLHTDWDPVTGPTYSSFQSTVSAGITALTSGANAGNTYEIVGMLWTQGERDGKDGRTTAEYQSDLNGFIAAIRGAYGSDLPFFYNRLSVDQTDVGAGLSDIRTAQANVAGSDANAYMIDADGFGIKTDNLHFDAAGQIALGEAFGNAYLSTVPEPSSLILLGAAAMSLIRRRRDN